MNGVMDAEQALRRLAQQVIADYRAGRVSLKRLVNDLDTVWSNLQPSPWRGEFREHWWTLEQVYAVALDRGEFPDNLPADALGDIEEALRNLEDLL
ncbi:hypothetical protein ACWEPC_43070 [Nonomuraea sp. NPDC004297]